MQVIDRYFASCSTKLAIGKFFLKNFSFQLIKCNFCCSHYFYEISLFFSSLPALPEICARILTWTWKSILEKSLDTVQVVQPTSVLYQWCQLSIIIRRPYNSVYWKLFIVKSTFFEINFKALKFVNYHHFFQTISTINLFLKFH